MVEKKRFAYLGGLIFLIALLERLLYLYLYSASPLFSIPLGNDVVEYSNWAREIIIWGTPFKMLHIHAPAYPVLLAFLFKIFSGNFFLIRFVQLMLTLLASSFLALTVAKTIGKKEKLISWLFATLALLFPLPIYYCAELLSEALLLPLLATALALLYWGETSERAGIKTFCMTVAGLCSGLAAVTHPMALLFGLGEVVVIFLYPRLKEPKFALKQYVAAPLLFLMAMLLPIIPTCVKNSRMAGHFVLIQQNSGFNFFIGNNPKADGTCYIRPGKQWNDIHREASVKAQAHNISEDTYFTGKAIDFITKEPILWTKLLLKKCLYVWNYREIPAGSELPTLIYYTWLMRVFRYFPILVMALAFAGLLLICFKKDEMVRYRHFIWLALSFWLMQALTTTGGRYRLAMFWSFCLFAAYALDYLFHHTDRSIKALSKFSICLLLGLAIVVIPRPPQDAAIQRSEAFSIIGEAYFKAGQQLTAKSFLKKSLSHSPNRVRDLNLLGSIELDRRQHVAERYFRMAMKAAPYESESYMNLAIIESKEGKRESAKKLFDKALNLNPLNPRVLYNYGFFCEKNNDWIQAEKFYLRCLAITPYDKQALNSLGVLAFKVRQYALASGYFKRLVQAYPMNLDYKLNFAVSLIQEGRRLAALNEVNKVLAIDPNNAKALELRKKLTQN